jgi:hypothetical protein
MMGNPNNSDSRNIMNLIPAGSAGAEIGVWMGSSSRQFLKRKLKKFYMVDPWAVEGYQPAMDAGDNTFNYDDYINKYSKLVGSKDPADFQKYYDKVYNKVWEEFRSFSEAIICRENSTDWFNNYDNEKLDWIYIDGDHSYTGVINDLNNCLQVMKEGSVIFGDDYKWGDRGDKGGVKKAVNEFVEKNNFTLNKHGKNQFSIRLP